MAIWRRLGPIAGRVERHEPAIERRSEHPVFGRLGDDASSVRFERGPHVAVRHPEGRAFPPKQKDLVVRDEVPIVHPDRMTALVRVLRSGIIEIHRAGLTAQGQSEKTMELYRYLTSDDFRQAFDSLEEIGRQLKGHLEDERKTHRRTWERREACYNELAEKMTVVDERIRGIIERPAGRKTTKVVQLPAS